MKLRFLPRGGFNKNGAFIEYKGDEPTGDEIEYERSWYLSLDIICDQLEVRTVAGIANENGEVKDTDRTITKLIVGKGTIQPARWGRFTLSFLGKKKVYGKVSLTIHSSEVGEATSFAGIYSEADIDLEGWDEFYVETYVHMSRFDAFVSELAEDGAKLRVHIKTSKFPNFYATWSPTISEGRKIKYLNSKTDVENADDIPEDFWLDPSERKRMLSDVDDPPVTFGVARPLKSPTVSTEYDSELETEDDGHDFPAESSTTKYEHSLQIERNNAILALVDATALLAAQVKRTGFWIIVCLGVLVLAALFS